MIAFLGLNIADSIITWRGLAMGADEFNWYRLLLGSMPLWAILAIKLLLAGLCAFLIYRYRRKLFKPLNIGMGLVVAFNLGVLIIGVVAMTGVANA